MGRWWGGGGRCRRGPLARAYGGCGGRTASWWRRLRRLQRLQRRRKAAVAMAAVVAVVGVGGGGGDGSNFTR